MTAQKQAWATQRTHTLSFEGAPPAAPVAQAAQAAPAAALSRTAQSGPAFPATGPQAAPPTAQPPAVVQTVPTVVPVHSAQAGPAAPSPRIVEAAAGATAAAANGRLAAKLDELGLTAQQVEAVLALSREVVERVVWEVVPQLAEVMIKEEISRLTRDG
jgi:hypothetical protein